MTINCSVEIWLGLPDAASTVNTSGHNGLHQRPNVFVLNGTEMRQHTSQIHLHIVCKKCTYFQMKHNIKIQKTLKIIKLKRIVIRENTLLTYFPWSASACLPFAGKMYVSKTTSVATKCHRLILYNQYYNFVLLTFFKIITHTIFH